MYSLKRFFAGNRLAFAGAAVIALGASASAQTVADYARYSTYPAPHAQGQNANGMHIFLFARSEERRVGKECRSRWSPYH